MHLLFFADFSHRHIDTSLNYGNQVGTGVAIKESGVARDQLYITSKYDAENGMDVTHEIKKTLSQVSTSKIFDADSGQLKLTYLDSYLIHAPQVADRAGGIKKVWPLMEKLVEDGLVRSIGISNWNTPELLHDLYAIAKIPPAVNQIE